MARWTTFAKYNYRNRNKPGVSNRWNSMIEKNNRYQSIKLVNWYRLVSANRWSIDNHTKIVHRLLSIRTATSNKRHARWKTDTCEQGDDEKEESIVLLLTFKALKWNVQPICNQSILIDILSISIYLSIVTENRYQSITTRIFAIDWSSIININRLIDIDCHRLFKSHVYGKRGFVPRDQVFPLIVVYCLLIVHKNK